jgi:outer membrane protein TolC
MFLLLLASAFAAEPAHLTLDAALGALDAHNPTLARAEAAVRAARGADLVALSGALPTLSVGGNYTRNNEEVSFDLSELFDALGTFAALAGKEAPEAPDAMVLQPLEAWTGSASVRVPILAPGSWASAVAGTHSVKAAAASEEATRASLRGAAVQGIWGEASAESVVAAQEATVERAKKLVTTAEKALSAGTGTRLGLLQAQTDLARREGDLLTARAALAKARLNVGGLLGQDGPVAVDLPAAPVAPAEDEDGLVAEALRARGEVRAAAEAVEAARGQVLVVQLGAAPTVSGTFTGMASTEPFITGEDTSWKATVDLSWPLLQGGLRAGNEAKARAALADAEAALAAAKLQVSQQVRTAAADLGVAAARVEVTGRQRALAEEAAGVAQRGFEEGINDTGPVLDALDRLDLARVAEIDAKARLGMADAALRTATGRW